MKIPRQGEIYWVELDPVQGHEQGKTRPCIVVSTSEFNRIRYELAWIVPITSNPRRHTFTVDIDAKGTGLREPGRALCHQLRVVSFRRIGSRIGEVKSETWNKIQKHIAAIVGLDIFSQGFPPFNILE
ncbi:type II toxin-antitoxin system PemK/MazF family toxin [bacterium]|nr:type II toxin-antitoxin system PemK/MazF family toxin [bacterium]